MGNNLKLAVDNTLTKEESEKIIKKAKVIGKIICKCNQAERIRNDYNKKYIEAVMASDTDKMIELTPRITEWGGRIRAYNECISLIMTEI